MSRRLFWWVSLVLLIGAGACSDDNPGPVAPPATPPQAATNLYSPRTSTSRVALRWRDNSENEVGFRILRRELPGTEFTALADTSPANQGTFEDRTVQANASYAYKVVTYTHGATAEPSNEVTVQAVQNASPTEPSPVQPADGAAEIDPAGTLTLEWAAEDPDNEPILYELRFGPTLRNMAILDSATSGTSHVLSGPFDKNSHYFWQVIAKDPKGVSSPSRIWGFNTVVDRQVIPAGYFFMGADPEAEPGSAFIHPGNPVYVDSAFTLDRYEVTNQQFADFLNQMLDRKRMRLSEATIYDEGGEFVWAEIRPRDLDSDISFSVADSTFIVAEGRETFPVDEVSWYGADAYARFYGRRLPTEAEWERAARGESQDLGFRTFPAPDSSEITVGLGFPFPWGAVPELNRLNVIDSGDPYENQGRVRSTPVGFYDGTAHGGYATADGASPYGVADMAGNLWEWCQDWYELYQAPHQMPQAGHFRILRGGSFNKPWGSAKTFNRAHSIPQETDRAFGFRTAGTVR